MCKNKTRHYERALLRPSFTPARDRGTRSVIVCRLRKDDNLIWVQILEMLLLRLPLPILRYSILLRHIHKSSSTKTASTTLTAIPPKEMSDTLEVLGHSYEVDSMTNVTPSIISRLGRKLLNEPSSPLHQLCRRIERHFVRQHPGIFKFYQIDDPIVSPRENFDELLIGPSHPSRSISDTYHINRQFMLRTHMTAHERSMMARGERAFLLAGDVYRRDEIDASHMPVFHQLEGVRIFTVEELWSHQERLASTLKSAIDPLAISPGTFPPEYEPELVKLAMADLYLTLTGLMKSIFGSNVQARWQETFFPFTQPSIEAEIEHGGKALELFGSGVLRREVLHPILTAKGDSKMIGWAFGMGLERVAMVLHEIPDIRLFWTVDPRFTSQFSGASQGDFLGEELPPIKFVPFSKYPPIFRDISFFMDPATFQPNGLYEIVRDVGGDLVEAVQLVDEYQDRQRSIHSRCYRIVYRSMARTLTDEEVNVLQSILRGRITSELPVTLR